jgi:hypothetical protein
VADCDGDGQAVRSQNGEADVRLPPALPYSAISLLVTHCPELRRTQRLRPEVAPGHDRRAAITPLAAQKEPWLHESVGVNSAIASQTGFYSGYGFAIPINLARRVMDQIIAHGRVQRAALGVTVRNVSPNDAAYVGLPDIRGVVVEDYGSENSPARKAGLEPGAPPKPLPERSSRHPQHGTRLFALWPCHPG